MTTDQERLASAIAEWAGLAADVLDRCHRGFDDHGSITANGGRSRSNLTRIGQSRLSRCPLTAWSIIMRERPSGQVPGP